MNSYCVLKLQILPMFGEFLLNNTTFFCKKKTTIDIMIFSILEFYNFSVSQHKIMIAFFLYTKCSCKLNIQQKMENSVKVQICQECNNKVEAGWSIQHVSKQLHSVIFVGFGRKSIFTRKIFEYLLLIFSFVTPKLTTAIKMQISRNASLKLFHLFILWIIFISFIGLSWMLSVQSMKSI